MRVAITALATAILLVLAALPAAEAQHEKVRRIGYLSPTSSTTSSPFLLAFREGLTEFGWAEGRNIAIEYRWAEARLERLPGLADELVRMNVDLIVTWGPGVRAAREATGFIPIVVASTIDLFTGVHAGYVASLARPGGNVTGLTMISNELMGKRLELLRQAVPRLSRLTLLTGPGFAGSPFVKEAERAGDSLGVAVEVVEVPDPAGVERALAGVHRARPGALYLAESPVVGALIAPILDFAAARRLPTMCSTSTMVNAGCLMSYGANVVELHRRAAGYVDRILRGAKPADLPVEQPTSFELVINGKTAKALGLTIPPSLLLRAHQIIE